MNEEQRNKLEMMEATNKYLDSTTGVWSSIPIVTNYKIRLSTAIDALGKVSKENESGKSSSGGSLEELKTTVAEKMDILDDILEAYAEDTKNEELRSKSDNSKTDYIRLESDDFEKKVKEVISLLEEHVGDMGEYGLTQSQIEDAKISLGSYQDQLGIPRTYNTAITEASQTIEELMQEAELMLDKLDNVLKRFQRSDVRFYFGYEEARMVASS